MSARGFCPPCSPACVGPALSPPWGQRRLPAGARGSLHLPLLAAAAVAAGRTGRPGSAPSPRSTAPSPPGLAGAPRILLARFPPGAALLRLCPARGAVPGVAGSERVAVGLAAAWMEEGNALAPQGGARQFPPSAPGAGDVLRRGPWVAGPASSCPFLLWDHLDWRAF